MVSLINVQPEESADLRKRYYEYLDELEPYEEHEYSKAESWETMQDSRIHHYWIYDSDEGRIVGFVFITWWDGIWKITGTWDIVQFTVFRGYRHKGIGTKAFEQVKAMFNGKIRMGILRRNPALKFWKRFGLTPVGVDEESGCLEYSLTERYTRP